MKYIFFTFEGLSLPIAWRLLNDGEEVYVCQVEDLLIPGKKEEVEVKRRRMSQYDGLIKKYTPSKMLKAMQSISNKDNYFIFFDFNNLYKYADIVQKMGFRNGLFPTEFDFKMETDRDMAQNFIKEHYPDVRVIERMEFKNIQDAINFINQSDKIWVLKGNSDDAKTVVPENNEVETAREILISALNEFKKEYESKGFILVEKIINPKEITPMIVFNNGEVIFTDIDIEAKFRDAGDVGVQVGAALSLVVRTNPLDEINKIAFPQIVYDMAKQRKGLFVWDLSLLIDENDNIYGSEYCSQRVGFDSIFAEMSMSNGKLFEKIVSNQNPLDKKFGVAIRIFNEHFDAVKGLKDGQKIVIPDEIKNETYVYEMKYEKELVSTNYSPDLAVITASDNDIYKAIKSAYNNVEKFGFDGKGYRKDMLSIDYPTSILGRYNYYLQRF